MLIIGANSISETSALVDPGTGDPAVLYSIERVRSEYGESDSAYFFRDVPVANGTRTLTINGTTWQVSLDGTPLLNLAGGPLKFRRLFVSHLRVSPLDRTQPASGTVSAAFTSWFTTSGHVLDPVRDDDCPFKCGTAAGYLLSGSSQLALTVTSPVNLMMRLLLIGKEA